MKSYLTQHRRRNPNTSTHSSITLFLFLGHQPSLHPSYLHLNPLEPPWWSEDPCLSSQHFSQTPCEIVNIVNYSQQWPIVVQYLLLIHHPLSTIQSIWVGINWLTVFSPLFVRRYFSPNPFFPQFSLQNNVHVIGRLAVDPVSRLWSAVSFPKDTQCVLNRLFGVLYHPPNFSPLLHLCTPSCGVIEDVLIWRPANFCGSCVS